MKALTIILLFGMIAPAKAQRLEWPVVKRYEGRMIEKVAMPVGGIGTGNISIGGNGQWRDVEIMNKPGVGFFGSVSSKQAPCFMIFTQDSDGNKRSKALMGPVSSSEYGGSEGSAAPNHGLPRFATASFDAGYPFAIVNLEDEEMPVSARARIFNPYIPADALNSGIPVAVIRYEVKNKTDKPLSIAIAGSLDNFIGMDGFKLDVNTWNRAYEPVGANHNKNVFRRSANAEGIYMTSDSVSKDASTWGSIALTTTEVNKGYVISHRTEFDTKGWNSNMTDMWDDFSNDGIFKDTVFEKKADSPRSALSVKLQLQPSETKEIQFLLTWHFPNRKDWNDKVTIGNYYTTIYKDAWDVAEKLLPELSRLEQKTVEFVRLINNSSYPDVVKEAALFNSSTLRSQTTFRNKEGAFFGWEGVFNATGSCWGNCTHVWNYEHASPFLFGELATSMRNTEYQYGLLDSSGLMSFRVRLPLQKNNGINMAAADGQMGTIMKVYREWQLSGDDAFLKQLWPGVKKALAFAWIPGGWDADKDGVMEGCQHNTMDIEYFGPNPEIEFWYLGALKAAAAMAHYLKDKDFEGTCKKLFDQGSKWTDENLFNGEFYIQKIQPIPDPAKIASGLIIGMGSTDLVNPDFQIGEGCLVDQLVGQNMAHICGLGYLARPQNIRKALKSIATYNYVHSFGNSFNNMRSYALGEESGLMLTAYPDASKRPAIPLSYGSEAWTGLEYTAATGMLYEGLNEEALKTISDVRKRYDGLKRNPFNEEECGNHYARAMASWSAIVAISEFNYSAVKGNFVITAKPGAYFWSTGYSWGNAEVEEGRVAISVHHGSLKLKSVELKNAGNTVLKKEIVMKEGDRKEFNLSTRSNNVHTALK